MSSMTEDTTYNGWANYPTWDVHLWLSNDQGLYNETLELVRLTESRPEDTRRIRTADILRDFVRDELAPDLGASFAADLLGYALDEVDWLEVADAFIEATED